MGIDNSYEAAINQLRGDLQEKAEDIKTDLRMEDIFRLHQALNTIEQLADREKTSLVEVFGLESDPRIRPDEFYGLEPLDAAKQYLRKRGEARPLDEIVEALGSGGCTVLDMKKLRTSLSRSTWEVAKVGDDIYGLVEFYDHVQRGKKKSQRDEGDGQVNVDDPELEEVAETSGSNEIFSPQTEDAELVESAKHEEEEITTL